MNMKCCGGGKWWWWGRRWFLGTRRMWGWVRYGVVLFGIAWRSTVRIDLVNLDTVTS